VEIDIVPNIGCGDSATMVEEGNASVPTTATAASAAVKSFHEMNTSIAALIRILCTISASGPNWVADASRPYLVTDGCMSTTNKSMNMTTPSPVQYDAVSHELKLTGYIRGNTLWNVNRPVHIPHLGTYSVKDVRLAGVHVFEQEKQQQGQKLLVLPPIVAAGRKHRKNGKTNTKGAENNVEIMNDEELDGRGGDSGENDLLLAESNIDEREPLDMFASPDALEGEQNLIGFDEDHDIDADPYDEDEDGQGGFGDRGGRGAGSNNTKQFQPGTTRPAGWSDYQSAWLDALDGEGDAEDHGELAFALNNKSGNKTNKYSSNDTLMGDDDDGDETEINAEAKRAFLAQRKKDASVDLQFPDEVDYEEETSARDRYARYRALKSFRKSYWDPKENLPTTYGAIYHFASFKSTQRDVLEDVRGLEEVVKRRGWGVVGVEQRSVSKRPGEDDNDSMNMAEERDSDDDEEEEEAMMARACVPPGAYVTITLENVPPAAIANLSPHTLLCAVSLLPHENKVSILHMGLAHSSKSEHDAESLPVKSKDVLTFRCGWRTWQSRPIFSQHNLNSDKHKFERFMPTGGGGSSGTFFAGSIFGPVSYAPCPVMMFREARVGGQQQDGTNSVSEGGGVGGIKREFLAQGSILGADADRIVLKRIVLTGYPTRVHKRHATVKYMFYNPEDVKVRKRMDSPVSFSCHLIPTLSHFKSIFSFSIVVHARGYYHEARPTGQHHPKRGRSWCDEMSLQCPHQTT
jgi:pre-rRNA-processing protein TSR1